MITNDVRNFEGGKEVVVLVSNKKSAYIAWSGKASKDMT